MRGDRAVQSDPERRVLRLRDDEEALRARIVTLATRYGRYGYRRITALLRRDGWRVNHKRVERMWRQEGLKVPQKQPKRGRLWLNDGSCVRLLGLRIVTMSGPMILWRIGHATDGQSKS